MRQGGSYTKDKDGRPVRREFTRPTPHPAAPAETGKPPAGEDKPAAAPAKGKKE